MRYRNTKTGVVFDSPFKIIGGDWVSEEKEEVKKPVKATTKSKAKE